MKKTTRNDGWTAEEDLLLGTTVISTVKEGGTQLNAFEKVAAEVGRTQAAVAFRWNSEIRKRFSEQLTEAKKISKENKKKLSSAESILSEETNSDTLMSSPVTPKQASEKSTVVTDLPFDIDKVIQFLTQIKEYSQFNPKLTKQINELQASLKVSETEKAALKKENEHLKREILAFTQQYEGLMNLIKGGKETSKTVNTKMKKEAVGV